MYFVDIAQSLTEFVLIKFIAAIILIGVFLFGEFHNEAIVAVLMLMIFDTFLGVMASFYEGQPITSRKFSRSVQKGIVYLIGISAAFFTDVTIGMNLVQPTMIAFVASTEFISILENIGRMGFETPKKLLNQLKDFRSAK